MSMTQEEVIALIKGIGGGGGGGTGEVISVNGKKGAVVLKAADIQDAENNTIQQRLDNTDENKQAKTDNSLQTTAKTIVGAINEVNSKPPVMSKYLSVERLGNYLFKATFDSIPDYVDGNSTPVGGCSAFVRDGKMFRNFDWTYDNTATFMVKCKTFEGIGSIVGLNDSELDMAKVGQLPYHIVDGVNTDGIMVSTHVLYNDFGYEGSGDKDKRIMGLPYYILSNVHSISDLGTTIADYLANLNIPAELAAMEYLVQFLVSDGTTTKVITPKTDGSGYEVVDATDNPKLTNFKWVADSTVVRTALQNRPTGVERWNLIGADTTLAQLKFTLAYESPDRLSEFIGIDGTTKDSTDEELTAIYNEAHTAYETRTRDGETWQTVHSVVYGANGIESLYVQEDYAKDYIPQKKEPPVKSVNTKTGDVVLDTTDIKDTDGNTIQERLDDIDENKQDKTDNDLDTTDKTVVGAINENKGRIDTLLNTKANTVLHLSQQTKAQIKTLLDSYSGQGSHLLFSTTFAAGESPDGNTTSVFTCQIQNGGGNNCSLFATRIGTAKVYACMCINNTWGDWFELVSQSSDGTVTANSDFTISVIKINKIGKHCDLSFKFKTTNALTGNTLYTIGAISSDLKPIADIGGNQWQLHDSNGARYFHASVGINRNGSVYLYIPTGYLMNANEESYVNFSYQLA